MKELIVRRCPECAPYLAQILRNKLCPLELRLLTLEMLCDMDRFVSIEQIPLGFGWDRYKELIDTRGEFNSLMTVDGRRIGAEAYTAVMWAAEQTESPALRFQARHFSGLLERDLRRLPLTEQIARWRAAVIKHKGSVWSSEARTVKLFLGDIIAGEAPESLPPLIQILQEDKNDYVRQEAIGVILDVDHVRMRLRGTDLGRAAVDAARGALEKCGMKPDFKNRKACTEAWDRMSANVFDDRREKDYWGLFASALHAYHGVEEVVRQVPRLDGKFDQETTPINRSFIQFLTTVDPYYPSWEYTLLSFQNEIFEPRFKERVARYYEQWKRFKAGEPPIKN
jgi:hypothetical protein